MKRGNRQLNTHSIEGKNTLARRTHVLSMMIGLILISTAGTGKAFWETPQVIDSVSSASDLRVDVTCRLNDDQVSSEDTSLRKPGVDGWLSYTSDDATGVSRINVKYYRMNNWYPREDVWAPTYQLPTQNGLDCWGQCIKGFYYQKANDASRGVPAAYLSYIVDQSSSGYFLISLGIIVGSPTGDYEQVQCASFMPEGDLDSLSQTHIVMAGNSMLLLWDQVDPLSSLRTIMMTVIKVKTIIPDEEDGEITYVYEKGPNIVVESGISVPQGLDLRTVIYNIPDQANNPGPDYCGAICWRSRNGSDKDEIHISGFKYGLSTKMEPEVAPQSLLVTPNPDGHTISQPRLMMSPCVLNQHPYTSYTLMTIAWRVDPVYPEDPTIRLQSMLFNESMTGWLQLGDSPVVIPIADNSSLYAMIADRGFLRPQSIAYDSASGLLAVAQMANHRINILEDPAQETGGVWISELYNASDKNTGSVTRIADSDIEIRQIGWLAVPEINGGLSSITYRGYSFPNHLNDELFPVRTEEMSGSFMDSIVEMEMVSDDYSSLYHFILTQNSTTGMKTIHWLCDGLLLRSDGRRDRLTHPYDMDFVPPVWTPTPTPTGSNDLTPLPTWTPRPDGLWVADMAGHRLVRLNMRGEILASTYTEDVATYTPTWSEYEHFTVISPNDVSASYDGSCWAIDWGRNRVVKIGPAGELIAATEPCDVPDPDQCLGELIHPLAIDCASDPNSCFVADYEGNRVYKLTLSGGSIDLQASSAQYYRPKAIAVSRQYLDDDLYEMVWVADRWSSEPTPSQNWTFTPVPTSTPTPLPGTPTAVSYTATPFPELQRASLNQFGEDSFQLVLPCTIPISMSVTTNDENSMYCFVADRDAGWSGSGKNYVRWLKFSRGVFEGETDIGLNDGRIICRPVDVEAVGVPPTCTPTPTP